MFAIGLASPAVAQSQPAPIVFGLVEDSTGPAAPFGVVSGRAIRAAVDYVNTNGGILGRQVKVIVQNDESDGTKTAAVTRRLIEDGARVIFYSTAGSAIMQAKPVVRDAKVVSFAPATITAAVASPPANEYMFSLGNASQDVTTVLCQAWAAAKIKKVAVFGDASATVDFILRSMTPGIQACATLVAQERAAVDANDVTAQITRLKAADPEAVLVISNGGQFEALSFQTIKRQIPNAHRFSTSGLGNQPADWKLARPGSLEGVIYTASVILDNPRSKMIEGHLRSKIPDFAALTAFDAWAWDSVMLAKAAIEKAGTADDGAKILEAMHAMKGYKPHFGQNDFTLSFGPDKHIGSDGLCGMIFNTFGADNRPSSTPWTVFQPKCGG